MDSLFFSFACLSNKHKPRRYSTKIKREDYFNVKMEYQSTLRKINHYLRYKNNLNKNTLFSYCETLRHVEIYIYIYTVYPKKYAHGFVVLCFVVVIQSFIMNSHEVFIHIHQGCFAGTGAIVRLPQCQWSKPDGYGKISQCITTTKHSKAKTVCIFLGIYCICKYNQKQWNSCFPLRQIYESTIISNLIPNKWAKIQKASA